MMRFFTPELYMRFNSDDDTVADRADEEWEERIQAYRNATQNLRRRPELADIWGLCLHDYERLPAESRSNADISISAGGARRSPAASITLRGPKEVVVLVYSLSGDVDLLPAPPEWEWGGGGYIDWMYDEFEESPEPGKGFVHRILWRDGTCSIIPFHDVLVLRNRLESRPSAVVTAKMAP